MHESNLYLAKIEMFFERSCGRGLKTNQRLQLHKLVSNLVFQSNDSRHDRPDVNFANTYDALTNFKANLNRRKTKRDLLTSARLMELTEPARKILLSDIAFVFRNEIDDYTQIDFGNTKHVELLKIALDGSISKVTNGQGRPVNEALDEFFVGLRDLYETETGKSAIAGAHFNGKPKTDFEKLIYLGYQIIRPAQEYQAALKAYERAISRNS